MVTTSIDTQLNQELNRVAGTCSAQAPAIIKVDADQGCLAELSVTAAEPIACQINQLAVRCQGAANWTPAQIQEVSRDLAARLQYLLEPVAPVEFDEESAVLQMRSHPPSRDEQDGREYYELTTDRGGVRLVRYQKSRSTPRTRIPMTLTREVLVKLVRDLAAAAAS